MGNNIEGMPLDSSLFNDQIEATGKHVVATAKLKEGYPGYDDRYAMDTPDAVWSTMSRTSTLQRLQLTATTTARSSGWTPPATSPTPTPDAGGAIALAPAFHPSE